MSRPDAIDIATFSRFPAGRIRSDGPFSGQRFREEVLVPALKRGGSLTILLDNAIGYGSSFLEEAFAGLVRDEGFNADDLLARLKLEARDPSLIDEIREYIDDARI